MTIQRIAAFAHNGTGGNPAGVVVADHLPAAAEMQRIAADVGYSETAFATPLGHGFRVRYFAPEGEVPFCGHATIALGAAIGSVNGEGTYPLTLNDAEISVLARHEKDQWVITLQSPKTGYRVPEDGMADAFMGLFGLSQADLDSDIPVTRIHGGADHLLIALKDRQSLQDMSYDFDAGAAMMQAYDLVTVNLIWRESDAMVHSRNPFAGHGVYEDPATGAAAAALGGFLRDTGRVGGAFEVFQGGDMGVPSRLWIDPLPGRGQPVRLTGHTRVIEGA